MTFAWVEGRRDEFPVSVMCRVLGVSRAGYYAWRTRSPSDTARRRDHLAATIRAIHAEPRMNTYGSPRMTVPAATTSSEFDFDAVRHFRG